ncbi:hypothetical protein QBC34DRAFT_357697 [Podospora aff. communis PSN243]|uniref:Rhodopsin domain-containing protein n=1 Tax=Podospora aff. communis PSN243 TaxID=3040156 RepID=A0AAV9GAB5_9PEZI|nr:hypothetical protein QBC34DRAFT_357697 [Podospora aff. communis PSN243]
MPTGAFIPITPHAAYLARVHFGVTVPLLALGLISFSARCYIRTWPQWRVGWDDLLIALGFMTAITSFALLTPEMHTAPTFLTYAEFIHDIKLAYLSVPLWNLAMTLIKTSIALTLLARFHPLSTTTTWWRPLILATIATQLVYLAANTTWTFTKCRPLSAAWDYSTPHAICLTLQTDLIVASIGSAVNIVTDVLLSLAPMVAVLSRLRRPRREKVLVCFLTGVGLLASGASIAKAVMVGSWAPDDMTQDSWANAVSIGTWTVAEMFIAVFGACSPSLKGPLERGLGRCGILLGSKGDGEDVDFVRVRGERIARGSSASVEEGIGEMGRSRPVRFVGEEDTGSGKGNVVYVSNSSGG